MSEYIKKEDAIAQAKASYRVAETIEELANLYEDNLNSLPTYSFPESKEMKQLYSDLLRVKHDTMNIDSLIDKVYADMRGNDK